MTFTPRLVALDVDGTTLSFAGELSPLVRTSVRSVAEQGVPVVVTSGRSVHGVLEVAGLLGFDDGLAVASNGAVVFSWDPVEVLHSETFDAAETVKLLLDQVPDAAVAVEEVGRGYRINKPFPEGEIQGEMMLQSVDELIAEPVTRVIIRSPDSSAEEFAELAQRLGLHGINYFVGYTAWLDLAPQGVTKASGLAVVCQRLGIDQADVLAIGDGHNDVEMLRWAGRGVAMGASPLEVQTAADDVTETVEADGVALELSRWF